MSMSFDEKDAKNKIPNNSMVKIADGNLISATYKGKLSGEWKDKSGKYHEIPNTDVLILPDLGTKLLSFNDILERNDENSSMLSSLVNAIQMLSPSFPKHSSGIRQILTPLETPISLFSNAAHFFTKLKKEMTCLAKSQVDTS